MTNKEIRMRCIEAITSSGIREPRRAIKDAEVLEEWVHAAARDKQAAPVKAKPK